MLDYIKFQSKFVLMKKIKSVEIKAETLNKLYHKTPEQLKQRLLIMIDRVKYNDKQLSKDINYIQWLDVIKKVSKEQNWKR